MTSFPVASMTLAPSGTCMLAPTSLHVITQQNYAISDLSWQLSSRRLFRFKQSLLYELWQLNY